MLHKVFNVTANGVSVSLACQYGYDSSYSHFRIKLLTNHKYIIAQVLNVKDKCTSKFTNPFLEHNDCHNNDGKISHDTGKCRELSAQR